MHGFWTAEFGSSIGRFGGGVVVFNEDGTLAGGDGGYYYSGNYVKTGKDTFRAVLNVVPFIEGYKSVFATSDQEYVLNLNGMVTDDTHATAQGNRHGDPSTWFAAKLTKRW
jgi:hypothetical protein